MPFRLKPSETFSDANIVQVDYVPPWLSELRDQSMDDSFEFDQCSICWGVNPSGASQPPSHVSIDPIGLV